MATETDNSEFNIADFEKGDEIRYHSKFRNVQRDGTVLTISSPVTADGQWLFVSMDSGPVGIEWIAPSQVTEKNDNGP